ncbi:hypothetical protein IHE55_00395 [Streptomyces pactum]|uniref:PatG C-terminal domain-containing protein n=1 Tax=Streptomyces pactum TaxID=68249 RepID=A0ABS0NDT7_9ACTN|nr:hypothetical protein [Streptomyces pactum]MBH5333340.1 hypothetical protein [Streptomyces pactum]
MEPEQKDVLENPVAEPPGEEEDGRRQREPTAPAGAPETAFTQAAGCDCLKEPGDRAEEARGDPAGPAFVYALGRIEARFPSLAVEKEYAQVVAGAESVDLTDDEALHRVLSDPQNRYLARQMCYVLTVQGLDAYLLRPVDPVDFSLLVEAVRPVSSPLDIDVVIGRRGPLAPPELCNGLTVPVVAFDQIYSFAGADLVKAVERPEKIPAKGFETAAGKLLERLMQVGDNAGTEDEHRAINYLAVRNEDVYRNTVSAYAEGSTLSAVEVLPSRLSGTRKVLDVVFSYTGRKTDVTEKSFVRVDVTEEFPFMVTHWSPYYDR